MENKVNKLYAIFDKGILFSDDCYIEAITGYDVREDTKNHIIFSMEDMEKNIYNQFTRTGCINKDQLWKYTCPTSGEEYYVGRNIFAKCSEKGGIHIYAIYNNYKSKIITTSLKNIEKFPFIFNNTAIDIKIAPIIGRLSRPDNPYYNTSPNMRTIQLPIACVYDF